MVDRLKWLTYLSLDAPLVAVAWQLLFADVLRRNLQWHHVVLVFSCVWLGYIADRWFDNKKGIRPNSEQHQFVGRHSRRFAIAWLITLAGSLILSFARLRPDEWGQALLLVVASLVYALFAQRGRSLERYPLLKSFFIGFLILASALLFVSPIPISNFSLAVASFATWALFTANCLFIRSWTRNLERNSEKLAFAAVAISMLLNVFIFWTHASPIAVANTLSLVALLVLNKMAQQIPTPTRRSLADICLLSPFLVILF